MPDFTITKARNAGEKDNPHGGKLVKWYIGLQDAPSGTEDVYVQKKPGNDLSPGMEISGRLEKGEYGWRLFPEQQQGNFKAPAHLRDGPGPSPVETMRGDPQAERSRRIERQHSQEMSLRVLALGKAVGEDLSGISQGSLRRIIKEWTDWFVQDLDADVGSGQAAHGPNSPSGDAADLSAETQGVEAGGGGNQSSLEESPAEASRSQKGTLTKLFHEAGLSREAMKAVVLFRCGSEKATKQGASQLITDLQDGATHDALLAEIYDASRAGNPLAKRAAALIPTEVPWEDDGSLPEAKKDEADVPF